MMQKRIFILLNLIILIAVKGFTQKSNSGFQHVVDSIIRQIGTSNEGNYPDSTKPQYEAIHSGFYNEKLDAVSSEDQLIKLMDNPHPVIKCYAFSCLANRHSKHLMEVLNKQLKSKDLVFYLWADIVELRPLPDILIQRVTSFCNKACKDPVTKMSFTVKVPCKDKEGSLTNAEVHKLDSVLIYTDGVDSEARSIALISYSPKEKDYQRIRHLVVDENIYDALPALARFKKPGDKELIKKNLNGKNGLVFAAAAVKEFPDQSFYPLILNLIKKETNEDTYDGDVLLLRELMVALTEYPTEETLSLYTKLISLQINEPMGDFILTAITLHAHKIFEPLKKKIHSIDGPWLGEDVLDSYEMHSTTGGSPCPCLKN